VPTFGFHRKQSLTFQIQSQLFVNHKKLCLYSQVFETLVGIGMAAGSENLSQLEQLILDAAGDGIYGIDKNGCVTFGNAATTKILGWRTDDILGKRSHDVHHHSHADGSAYPREECPIYAATVDGLVHREQDEVFWHTNGNPVPVEYTSTPIMRDGKIDGAVVVFRDISARKALEHEREQSLAEISALKEQLELERDYLRDELEVTINFGEIVGESAALKRSLAQIEAVAATPATVLVLGESGVGKEMIARAIHCNSERAEKALVKVNCASIPKDLFESEFFGHVRGAFTGAHADRVGRLQLADGGTLFLDEVGEIPLDQQGKLLRALQERQFERVGDDKTISADVRIVAATNRDLEVEVREGRFREDLYYRLSVFPLTVPPLRERREDIIPLALHFIGLICREQGRPPLNIGRQAIGTLQSHDWPGNIRELRNVIERAIIMSKGDRLRLDLAMVESKPESGSPTPPTAEGEILTDQELRELERANMLAALHKTSWRISGDGGAADLLALKPSTLAYRMSVFGIVKER
jgi:PAS domain S-box-containing protein